MNTLFNFIPTPVLLTIVGAELIGVWWLARDIERAYYRRKVTRIDFPQIDRMEGAEFEAFLETLFKGLGYRATNVADTGDYGADLIVRMNGQTIVVQAKRYRNNVGLSAVQEIVAAKAYYKGHAAMVVTNSYFTRSARVLADANNVTLWDRTILAGKLTEVHAQNGGLPLPTLRLPALLRRR